MPFNRDSSEMRDTWMEKPIASDASWIPLRPPRNQEAAEERDDWDSSRPNRSRDMKRPGEVVDGNERVQPSSEKHEKLRNNVSQLFVNKTLSGHCRQLSILLLALLVIVQLSKGAYYSFHDCRMPILRMNLTESSAEVEILKPLSSVSVLFALAGNHPGLLAEFEVALKSVLLNAPLESNLSVYIMADSKAYGALGTIFDQTGLNGSMWRNRVSLESYNVEPYLGNWTRRIESMQMDAERHTIGTYFRLYAHEVLPNDVNHVLYMDTDVVVMANLDDLWKHVDQDMTFQWGEDKWAGFMILNLQKLDTIWDMASRCDLHNISELTGQSFNDQLIFLAVNHAFPNVVGVLPEEWAISVANGAWKHAKDIVDYRPKIGMLHFNGGGASKDPYWEGKFVQARPDTWGAGPLYFAKLPWTWARFVGESMQGAGKGHPLIIRHGDEKTQVSDQTLPDLK